MFKSNLENQPENLYAIAFTKGDKIVYNVGDKGCEYWAGGPVDPAFCLSMQRWAEIIDFCSNTGIRLVFGLNGMTRSSDTSHSNFTNIDAFLQWISSHNQASQWVMCFTEIDRFYNYRILTSF